MTILAIILGVVLAFGLPFLTVLLCVRLLTPPFPKDDDNA